MVPNLPRSWLVLSLAVLVIGIGPVGLMSAAGANFTVLLASLLLAPRPVCVEAAIRRNRLHLRRRPIWEQVMSSPVARAAIASASTAAVARPSRTRVTWAWRERLQRQLPSSGDYVNIPRVEWGVGMGHAHPRRPLGAWQPCPWRSFQPGHFWPSGLHPEVTHPITAGITSSGGSLFFTMRDVIRPSSSQLLLSTR